MAYGAPFRQMLTQVARDWWLFILRGIVAILFGIIAWAWPDLTATTLMILIGFWAIVVGAAMIVSAIRYRREIANEWSLGLSGLASLAFGLIITISPATAPSP